jgi:hypothetical protein
MAQVTVKESPVISPLAVLAGDQLVIEGTTLKVIRSGVQIATRELGPAANVGSGVVGGPRVLTSIFQVEVKNMPGQNVSCTKVTENQTTGSVTMSFSSGSNTEYASWADVGAIADTVDASPEFAEKILTAKAFRASPDGANKTNQVGAMCSVNCLADTPIDYTPPQ